MFGDRAVVTLALRPASFVLATADARGGMTTSGGGRRPVLPGKRQGTVSRARRRTVYVHQTSVSVTGNQFSFPVSHPAMVKATPGLRDAATSIYNASIAPDGTIKGLSNDTNTVMDGRVAGTRMTGQIYGLLCYYAFTADRN
jgi:hypothetical protein